MTEMIIRGLNELIFSPRPYFCVIGDLRIGPNCLGSPASTSWPPMWWLGSKRSATGMMHSGSVAWPASSIKMCVKWLRGKQAETNLGKQFWNKKVKSLPCYDPSRVTRIIYKPLFGKQAEIEPMIVLGRCTWQRNNNRVIYANLKFL